MTKNPNLKYPLSSTKYFHQHFHQRGSLSLEAMFSSIGIVFVLSLFINLFRYVTALNAVEQASIAVARCLTPSDGKCLSLNSLDNDLAIPPTPEEIPENPQNPANTSSINDSDLHKIEVTWLSLESFYFPRFSSGFPSFNEQIETASDNLSQSNWLNKVRGLSPDIVFSDILDLEKNISSGQTEMFDSGLIKVPALDKDTPCHIPGGCDVSRQAGADKQGDVNFHDYASVSLKVFAQVTALNNSRTNRLGKDTEIQWGTNDSPGLEILIYDANGQLLNNKPRCLGGASKETVSSSQANGSDNSDKWYNLRLRGPKDSNGGTSAICPDQENGRNGLDHSMIQVPRGGSFRVRGYLSAFSGDVRAQVNFLSYFDDYVLKQKDTTIRSICEAEDFANSDMSNCSKLKNCSPKVEGRVISCKKIKFANSSLDNSGYSTNSNYGDKNTANSPNTSSSNNSVNNSSIDSTQENTDFSLNQINFSQVQLKASEELSRAFQDISQNCNAAGCSNVAVDLSIPHKVKVTVKYHLPLFFPLDVITQKDALEVSHTKEEVMELRS